MMDGPMQAAFEKAEFWKTQEPTTRSEGAPEKPKRRYPNSRKSPGKHRKEQFSVAFKERAVALVKEVGNVRDAARQLEVTVPTLATWVYIVEHGGELTPSLGWKPEHGDRYVNPKPGVGRVGGSGTSPYSRMDLDPTIVNPVIHRDEIMAEAESQGDVNINYITGNGSAGQQLAQSYPDTNPIWPEPSSFEQAVKELEAKRAGLVPAHESYIRVKKLEAENEALRQIIRGYQSLLNLT